MLPANIKELINENSIEWECLELKEGYNDEAIIHSICAFANDINNLGGGHIIIGFKENSGRPVFPLVGLNPDQIDSYQKKLRALCNQLEPFYTPLVKPYLYDGKMILVMWVSVGDQRPYKAPTTLGSKGQKRYYIRQASNSVIANATEEARLIAQSAKVKFESRVHFDTPINAFNVNLINEYLKATNSNLYPDSLGMTLDELCNSIVIAKGPKGDLRPLNLGLLLFADNPDLYFSGALIDLIIFQDEEGTEFTEKTFEGPLNKQITAALEFIKINIIKEKVRKVEGQAESLRIFNYPYQAIEEALVNAVYHRSYEVDNKIEIRVFPDVIQIINFPGPLPPVNEQTILQDRIDVREYRNPVLGKFLKDFRLSEERGTGIATIRKEMKKNGSLAPEFDFGDEITHFMIILKIHPEWHSENYREYSNLIGHSLSNEQQIILELAVDGTLFKDIQEELKSKSKEEINSIIQLLIERRYLTKRTVKGLFGFVRVTLYATTSLGSQILKQSF